MENQNDTTAENKQEDKLDDLFSMDGYDKPVRRARTILFVIAALSLVPLFMMDGISDAGKMITIAIVAFEALVFIALAFWTVKKPYYAIIAALAFYSLVILFYAVLDPATIVQGILIKIVV